MEYCIEARALKSSFLSQMAMKTNSHNDDVWCFTGVSSVPSDDFPVEDLLNLDFPDKEYEECLSQEDEEEKVAHEKNLSLSSSNFSGADELDDLSAGELVVPDDDLENLEWLSQFVDDSTSEVSLLCPAGSFAGDGGVRRGNRVEGASKPLQKSTPFPCLPVPVQRKARSKRPRPHGRPWYVASPPLSTTAESSSTSSSHCSSDVPHPFIFTKPVLGSEGSEKPAAKRKRKKPEAEGGAASGRRCTHCQVQKTPQWRAGPLGPKTLCNACGVRFKSGRLFPEYRPACSPTFSQEMHSNSHRKVLEMRLKKETAQAG